MKLNRRSFLRSLGAALLAPLLPRAKQVEQDVAADLMPIINTGYLDADSSVSCPALPSLPSGGEDEKERITDFLMSCDCSESAEANSSRTLWSVRSKCEGCDLCALYADNDFTVADDYFLPYEGSRYSRADWTFELNSVEFEAALHQVFTEWPEKARETDWSAVLWLTNDAKWCSARLEDVTFDG
jgi:hypothetical protein